MCTVFDEPGAFAIDRERRAPFALGSGLEDCLSNGQKMRVSCTSNDRGAATRPETSELLRGM
jgi:hypothetical protein